MPPDVLSSSLSPVTRQTLVEQVETILKRLVLMEDLNEGDQLPSERQLAAALGVSHTVVREALSVLAREGLIIKRHGLGNFVASFEQDNHLSSVEGVPKEAPEPADLHRARCAIECGAAYLAAEYATDEDIATLLMHIQGTKESPDQAGVPPAENLRFHLALLKATHNETLQGLSYLIADSIRLFGIWNNPAVLQRGLNVEQTVRGHEAIVRALRERDGARASQAMHHHLTWWMNSTEPGKP